MNEKQRNGVINALSVDVEEWYQTILFIDSVHNSGQTTGLQKEISEILELFDEYNTKATFFILGTVAQKYPGLVKTICNKGHEAASHGYNHRLAYKMSPDEFIGDVGLSLKILRSCSPAEILGYRASTWSMNGSMAWAIEALKSLRLRYDSSIYPLKPDLFCRWKLPRFPYEIAENFIEFPPSTFRFFNYNFPFAGGTFLRFLPFNFISSKIAEINNKGFPAMIYFHSWEFNDKIQKHDLAAWKRVVQYGNAATIKTKLRLLLRRFKFSSVKDVLRLQQKS